MAQNQDPADDAPRRRVARRRGRTHGRASTSPASPQQPGAEPTAASDAGARAGSRGRPSTAQFDEHVPAHADEQESTRASSEPGPVPEPQENDLAALEGILGHRFHDRQLLRQALTHRSFANEHPGAGWPDNERLEFLGDAVLDLAVGHMLMDAHPQLGEGRLSVTRAQVVSEEGLSELAYEMGLGRFLFLGKGERKSGGRNKRSILADTLEAVIAAVYRDGGFEAAWRLVARLFERRIATVETTGFFDHKTRLQELAQARLRAAPVYRVVGDSGPDHAKIFEVCVEINGHEWGRAVGSSKKRAEQIAAANAAFLLAGADLEEMGLASD